MGAIDDFISQAQAAKINYRGHFNVGPVNVYCRKRQRIIATDKATVLDIGNVNVDPKERGKGHFKAFLHEMGLKCPWPYLYVENVHNMRLAAHLEKSGWVRDPLFPDDHCYYLRVKP